MMREETSKQRIWSEKLYEKASEFHGHGGPFMIVGLMMGLTALNKLDAFGWFNISCTAYLRHEPPISCVIDGIQSSTGCTMGKNNIHVRNSDGVVATFTSGDKTIRVELRSEVLTAILEKPDDDEEKTKWLMEQIIGKTDNELFTITAHAHSLSRTCT